MLTRRVTRLIAVLPTLAAGCALPLRDNEHDPANAPRVVVQFVDFTDPDGGCGVMTASSSFVTVASRGRCLAADGRESRDADGDLLGEGTEWKWSVIDPADAEPVETLPQASLVELDDGFRHDRTPNAALNFRLDVTDRSGNRGSGTASLVLLNSPPLATAGPSRTVPAGGLPWAPGLPIAIPFSGSATDPDGDDVQLCWEFPGEAESCGGLAPVLHDVPVDTPGRYVARLRAFDGNEYSAPAGDRVLVADPNLWLTSRVGADGGVHFRVDPAITTVPILGQSEQIGNGEAGTRVAGPNGRDAAALLYGTYDGFFGNRWLTAGPIDGDGAFPAGLPLGPTFSPTIPKLATNPSSGDVWMLADGSLRHFAIAESAGSLSVAEVLPQIPSVISGGGYHYLLEVDGAGHAWVASRRLSGGAATGGLLNAVDETTGVVTTLGTSHTLDFTAIERRPGGGEVWVSSIPNSGAGDTVAPGIFRYSESSPGSPPARIAFDNGVAGLAFVSDEEAWLSLPGEGLFLVDVSRLLSQGFDASIVTFIPASGTATDLLVDPDTGDCHAVGLDPESGTAAAFRADTLGGLEVVPDTFTQAPLFLDSLARRYLTGYIGLTRTRSASITGITGKTHLPMVVNATGGYDATTGGLWMPVNGPTGLARFAEDGTLLRLETETIGASGVRPMPEMTGFRLAPDGNRAWAFAGQFGQDGMIRLEFLEDAVERVDVLADPDAYSNYQNLRPSSPAAATPFVWAWDPAIGIGTFPADGAPTLTPIHPTTILFDDMELAPASSDLCVVEHDLANFPDIDVVLTRLQPDGTVLPLATVLTTGNMFATAGAFSGWTGDADACWFWIGTVDYRTRVIGFEPNGTLIGDAFVPGLDGRGVDGAASSESRLWLIINQLNGLGDPWEKKARIDIAPDGTISGGEVPGLIELPVGYSMWITP